MTNPSYIISIVEESVSWDEGPQPGQLWERTNHKGPSPSFLGSGSPFVLVVNVIVTCRKTVHLSGQKVTSRKLFVTLLQGEKIIETSMEPVIWLRLFKKVECSKRLMSVSATQRCKNENR